MKIDREQGFLRVLAAAYLSFALVFAAAAVAESVLERAILELMAALTGAVAFLGSFMM